MSKVMACVPGSSFFSSPMPLALRLGGQPRFRISRSTPADPQTGCAGTIVSGGRAVRTRLNVSEKSRIGLGATVRPGLTGIG
jgi:hypothetical protein